MVHLNQNITGTKIGKQLIYSLLNIYVIIYEIFKKYIINAPMYRSGTYNIPGLIIFIPLIILSFWACSEKKDGIKDYSSSFDSLHFDSTSVDFDLGEIKERGMCWMQ